MLEFYVRANPSASCRVISRGDRYWSEFDLKLLGQPLHRRGACWDWWTEAVFVVFDWAGRAYDNLIASALRTIRLRTRHFGRPVNIALVSVRPYVG